MEYDLPTASDNCGATVSLTSGIARGGVFNHTTTWLSFVAVDAAGLSAACSYTVTVVDTEAPKISKILFRFRPNLFVFSLPGSDDDLHHK